MTSLDQSGVELLTLGFTIARSAFTQSYNPKSKYSEMSGVSPVMISIGVLPFEWYRDDVVRCINPHTQMTP
jgi:hypothetical protein